jgi:hypothetical protein
LLQILSPLNHTPGPEFGPLLFHDRLAPEMTRHITRT